MFRYYLIYVSKWMEIYKNVVYTAEGAGGKSNKDTTKKFRTMEI